MVDFFLEILSECGLRKKMYESIFTEIVIPNLLKKSSYFYFEFDWFFGVSKGVIVPKDYNWVIKIPFYGCEEEAYNYDYSGKSCYCNANSNPIHNWDYCFTEVNFYKAAKSSGLHQVFCKEKYIGSIDNCPIYIQQKASSIGDLRQNKEYTPPKEDSKDKTKSKIKEKNYGLFDLDWQTDACLYYGEKYFIKLMKFLRESCIKDLHKDNIGYIGKQPVIFDFSDFLE